jgi:glutamate racemase
MTRPPRILLFDSGLGGLTVARAVRALIPDAHYMYAADVAAFPYGAWDEARLVERIVAVMARLIVAARPDVVVVACNTASTLALAQLRAAFTVPFVGTVPAIKPAAEHTTSRIIGVLATPGTVNREYTQTLIHTFAFHCRVVLHGAPRLAGLAEDKLKGACSRSRCRPRPRSGPCSAAATASAPTPWCWAAPIIRCCFASSRPPRRGRLPSSTRHRPLPSESPA